MEVNEMAYSKKTMNRMSHEKKALTKEQVKKARRAQHED